MTNWYGVSTPEEQDRLLGAWSDAPVENLEVVAMILEVAREQVIAYAPADVRARLLDSGVSDPSSTASVTVSQIPASLIYAQLQQARNLWNAGASGNGGEIGADGYSFTPRPLDKTIRSIIRPSTGAANVF